MDKKDFKKLMEKFDGDEDYESDDLLKKTGGLKGLLEFYLKKNPDALEKKDKKKKREKKAGRKDSG